MKAYISRSCELVYSEISKRGKDNRLYGDNWMYLPSKFPFWKWILQLISFLGISFFGNFQKRKFFDGWEAALGEHFYIIFLFW